jgi:hypothetical protein
VDSSPTLPIDSTEHIDNVLSPSRDHWEAYTTGIRRIYFSCRTKGYNPMSASGVIDFLCSVLGKETVVAGQPLFDVMSWVWHHPEESWLLIVSTRGVEFRVPKGLTPEDAFGIWKQFHNRFTEPGSDVATRR